MERSLLCPVLIGREAQLDRLVALGRQIEQGRVALVAGEAGIGKSRLVTEAKLRWRSGLAPLPIVEARCFEADRLLPYGPLVEIIRNHLERLLDPHLLEQDGPLAPVLARLLPQLAQPLSEQNAPLESEQEKRRIFQALVRFFDQCAAGHPLVVILEDVHWLDEASLEFLIFWLRALPSQPILLLLTYRSDEMQSALERLLEAITRERSGVELPLARLTLDETEAMLQALLGNRSVLGAGVAAAIHKLTEGNPFFTEEVTKSLITGGELALVDGQWQLAPLYEQHVPRSVQMSVQRRVARLTPAAKELLALAAVAGRRFDFDLLQQLTGQDESALLRLLKALIEAQLVVEESADRFAFRHALTRQAVVAGLLARERRALHRAVGDGLEALAGDRSERLSDLAYQFYQAEDWPKAMRYAVEAGQRAQALYSPGVALDHFTHALLAARRLKLTPPPALHRTRGQLHEFMGSFEAALGDYEEALAAAVKLADLEAEWQSLLDLGFLWTARDYSRAGGYFDQAIALARRAGKPALLAHTLNRVGNWHVHAEQPLEALRYHQEAYSLFQALHDHQGMLETLDFLGVTSYMGGDILAGAAYYAKALALYQEGDDRRRYVTALLCYALRGGAYFCNTLVWMNTPTEMCLREGEEAVRLAQEIHWQSGEAYALIVLGHIAAAHGRFQDALTYATRALAIAEEIEHAMWTVNALLVLGEVYYELFALAAAREHLQQALAQAHSLGSLYAVRLATALLSQVYLGQGERQRADELLATAIQPEMPTQTLAERLVWTAQAEWLLASGNPTDALTLLDRLIATAANVTTGNAHEGDGIIPRLWMLRGIALATLRHRQEAEAVFLAADRVAQAQILLSLRWRIQTELGKLYRANRQHEAAATAKAVAQQIVEELAGGLEDTGLRARFRAGALGLIPTPARPSARFAAKQAYDGLTPREREIASLIAQGKSNRLVGEMLVLSERTVEKHVENILSKLGFSSRTQIAVWAAEKGLR